MAARVIFIAGDIADFETQLFIEETGRPVLTKPVALQPLAMTLVPFLGAASPEMLS